MTPAIVGAKRRGTDWSACMKNRHRVSQVVNKLICSRRFGSITDVYVGAADCGEYREAAGTFAPKHYCGKPQLYQSLVQYIIVGKAFCSTLAARSSASSGISKVRISSSVSA